MIDKINQLIAEAEAFKAQSKDEVEAFRIKYLGKKDVIPGVEDWVRLTDLYEINKDIEEE